MSELNARYCARLLYRRCGFSKTVNVGVAPQTGVSRRDTPFRRYSRGFDHQQPNAAARQHGVMCVVPVIKETVLHLILTHRRCGDPVTEGAKQIMLAGKPTCYRAGESLLTTVDLPVVSHVTQASAEQQMMNKNLDASSAALFVGYESASQFSREYSREFGESPLRDIRRLRTEGES